MPGLVSIDGSYPFSARRHPFAGRGTRLSVHRASPRRDSICQQPRRLFILLLALPCVGLFTPPLQAGNREPLAEPSAVTTGVLTDNYPFSYSKPDGSVDGFAVDLLAEIERVMALRLERRIGGTREINGAFEAGQIDLVQSYARTPAREMYAHFSQPYVKMGGSIFVRKTEQKVQKLSDLRGRRVMVHPGSQGEQVLRDAGMADSIVHVDSTEHALRLLDQGSGDATLVGRLNGLAIARRLGLRNIEPVGDPVYQLEYCFAARKGRGDIVLRIDEGLLIIKRQGGPYETLYRKWFGDLGGYTRRDVLSAVAIGLAIALLVTVWALLRQRSLHLRLAQQAKALRASEERHRSIFEVGVDAMLVLSASALEGGGLRIEQANPAAGRLLATDVAELAGMLLLRALPDGNGLVARIAGALQTTPVTFEHEVAAAPKPLWLRASVTRMDTRILLVLADITDAKQAEARLKKHEQQLRQQQKLEAIGTMAGGIAHDFNNLLTGIVGNAELARLEIPAEHPSVPCIDEILAGSERARKLVRQILTFSRQNESRPETVNVGSLIEETLRFIRASVPAHICVQYVPPVVPCEIEADPTQIHQVLLNLYTNALHAMGENQGVLEIVVQRAKISEEEADAKARLPAGPYVHITVRDSGCGMSPEVQQRIFEPFFTTKPTLQGTGLGLSVAHGIVQQHHGEISVYSRPGQGSVFHLRLPLRTAGPSGQVSKPSNDALPHGRGEHVLVIDDDPAIIQTADRVLTRIGYRVTTFNDPLAAVEAFARRPGVYDVIICDLTMNGLSGLQVAERVGPGCPFILISGYVAEKDRAEARARGITHIIDKPLHLADLARCLADCLKPYRA